MVRRSGERSPTKSTIFSTPRFPACCPDCGGGVVEDRVDQQYQTEIPPIEPKVTQFDVHIGHCQDCGRRVQGRHPQQTSDALGAAASQLGPRAQALATHFQKELGLSFGKAKALLGSVFGIDVSRGGLAQAILRAADRLEPTHREIVSALPRAPVITPDETGWRVGGEHAWLWIFRGGGFGRVRGTARARIRGREARAPGDVRRKTRARRLGTVRTSRTKPPTTRPA
jgi:transposase